MTMRQLLRQGWENLVGLVFAVAGLLLLLMIFWVNYVLAGLRAANMLPVTPISAEAPPLVNDVPEEVLSPTLTTAPAEPLLLDESKLLPTEGIYIIDGQSLDATVNEIIRREQARIAAEKAAAEAKRKRKEEARRQRLLEQKRKEEEAKRRKLEKQQAEAKRKEESRRKAEAAKQRQLLEQKKAEEAKRKAAQKQKAAEEKRRKAEAAVKRKAEEARRKVAAQQKAAQEARRKAKEARELDAKLAALGASAPSLEGGLQSTGSIYDQRDIDGYAALLDTAVSRYYRLPDNIPNNLEAKFVIKINSSGQVVDVVLQRSSGYPLFDREARNAIFAASPLPLPDNSALRADTIKQGIEFTFNP